MKASCVCLAASLLIFACPCPAEQNAAITEIRKAAEQGRAEAQFKLGVCYTVGVDVGPPSKNFGSSGHWYECVQSCLPVTASRQYTVSMLSRLPIV